MTTINMTSSQAELQQYHKEHLDDYKKFKDHREKSVVGVQFRGKKKIYKFNNIAGFDIKPGQFVLVLTHLPHDKHDKETLQIEKARVAYVYDYNHNKVNPIKYREPIIDVL